MLSHRGRQGAQIPPPSILARSERQARRSAVGPVRGSSLSADSGPADEYHQVRTVAEVCKGSGRQPLSAVPHGRLSALSGNPAERPRASLATTADFRFRLNILKG